MGKYLQYDLHQCNKGEGIKIYISGSSVNLRLMDSSNLQNYKNGRRYHFYGGRATKSPVTLWIPHSGHWYLVADFQGLSGSARISCKKIPAPLEPIQDNIPLRNIPSLFQENEISTDADSLKDYDVFISHASEDKDEVVRPLATALQDRGISVWYDEFELRIGDSLRRKIDKGLARSRFGIVVISRSFIAKGWTNYELDGMITKAISGEQIMLPIWHDITKQEVIDYSPSLADKVARNTATSTIDEIAEEIASLIIEEKAKI